MYIAKLSALFSDIIVKQSNSRVAVTVLLINDDKVLGVARRDTEDQWGLPGGKLEPGETLEDCGVRETYEETGLKLDPAKLSFVYKAQDGPFTVYTFMYNGEVSGKFRQMDAGPVDWVTWKEMFEGPFGVYNRSLFLKLVELNGKII